MKVERNCKKQIKEVPSPCNFCQGNIHFLDVLVRNDGHGHKVERNCKKQIKEVPSPCNFCHDVLCEMMGMGIVMDKKRLIVGISGASGAILGINILELLRENPQWETHLIISAGAELTIAEETEYALEEVINLADRVYDSKNIGASIASGTYKTEGMVIVPCSMKTVAGVASGYSDNLLLRAADVTLKEGRRLIIVPRESPLSTIHLRNLLILAEAGVMVIPPMLTYYNKPRSIEDMSRHMAGKILDKFGIEIPGFKRWK